MVTKKNTGLDVKGILNSLEDTTMETENKTTEQTDTNTDTDIEKNTNDDTNINTNDSINTTTKTNIDTNTKFVIKKKVDDKKDKKAFNVYMADSLVKDLDKLSKKTGYSRNELINMMVQSCINNYEIVEE